ncbi:hypothetical protein BFJ70_g13679 [Fusarium oxysporum]|uniref:Clr5 domain-containing protein n=2 Tax=Fusarium oxysporum TaxID=5507 RepID=A0A420RSN0_FUSOX|nr:hypothetical protein BFJ65_g3872 [Fusarium oxysporum f. sp. cepae]RKL00682.1 hypothetical protein BFJ68_g12682 [Fusarium oxysporum]RKK36907.1 hypothetical protein BFJ67_g12600 [Fusarium oxysporum f. sp. cepae]RKK38449.1 hypothetical protein BFJ66_g12488 [Fusarium oxysporum f. sp. cepae]RKL00890.1 hypothetical protein BFJ71_g5543 [Fusarium oxysporum]
MAPREIVFAPEPAPRAARLSDKAVDEHEELIGDLYWTQNWTRDQVINYLQTNLSFTISKDQFSKQRDVGVSTSSPEEAALSNDRRMRRPAKARLAKLPVTSHPVRPPWMALRTKGSYLQMSQANVQEVAQAPAVAGVISQPMGHLHLFLAAH